MEKRDYTNEHRHFDKMMDENKLTSRLFGLIPFSFMYTKFTMAVYMAIPILMVLLIFSLSLVWVCVIFVVFLILNIEYNRVFDYRDAIMLNCIQTQLVWEAEIKNGVPQLPDAPDYIDQTDIELILEEALWDKKKPTFFRYVRELLVSKIKFKDEIDF